MWQAFREGAACHSGFAGAHRTGHSPALQLDSRGDLGDVFVAAAGEIDDDEFVFGHFGDAVDGGGDGVGGFEGGDDAFEAGEFHERVEGFVVGGVGVVDAVFVFEPGVFRSNGGVVQAGRDAVGELDLAVFVLEDVGTGALQDAEGTALKSGGVFLGKNSFAAG